MPLMPGTSRMASILSIASWVSIIGMTRTWSLAIVWYVLASPYMAARIGPLLRLPAGGYRHAFASALASCGVFTIGQITPQAPPSSTLPMMPGSFHGTRTIGVTGWAFIA